MKKIILLLLLILIFNLNNILSIDNQTYVPFSNQQVTTNAEYVPFSDQQTIQNTEYVPFGDVETLNCDDNDKDKNKCKYCGNKIVNNNCHLHEHWCPYYCHDDDENPIPIGDNIIPLLLFVFLYTLIKMKK